MKPSSITRNDQIKYGLGNYGYGLISYTISSYLVFYGTAVLFIPGKLIGLIVSLSILWDAVSDPLMGYVSDNTNSKYGRRHVYILAGTILMAGSNYFLWTINTEITMLSKFMLIFLNVMLVKTFITIFITPYNALGSELVSDYDGRSSIQSIKSVFYLFSLLSTSSISMFIFFTPTVKYPIGQLNPDAYKNMSILISIIMLITGLISYFSTRKYLNILPKNNKLTTNLHNFIGSMKIAFKSKNYKAVLFGYSFINLASAIIGTVGLHIFTFTFLMNNYHIGIVFGTQLITSIVTQPIWLKISKKIDKKNAIILGLNISIVGCIVLLYMVSIKEVIRIHYGFMLIYAVVTGFGTSGLFFLPLSMITDTVDLQELNHGKRNEGVYFGLLNFGYKVSQSLAILLFGFVLDIIKFNPALPHNSNATLIMLGASLPIGSLASFLLAKHSFKKYTLNREILFEIQEQIKTSTNK
ncbi:MAG: MFS transporter [Clostridiales bacterium]|nr:MFS transporter [Clostridiales bacterium]